MRQLLIGISTTGIAFPHMLANYLREQHGLIVVEIAEPYEEAAAALIEKAPAFVREAETARLPALEGLPAPTNSFEHTPTPASIIHALRHEFAHSLHPDFITTQLEQRLQHAAAMHSEAAGFVIPDLVFSNEADFIRSHDGLVIHLQGQLVGGTWLYHGRLSCDIKSDDFTVQWHGTMTEVRMQLDDLVAMLRSAEAT